MHLLSISNCIVGCNHCGKMTRISFGSDYSNKEINSTHKMLGLFKSKKLDAKSQEDTDSEPSTSPLLELPPKGRLADAKSRMGFVFSKSEIAHLAGGITMVIFVELTLFPLLLSWFFPADPILTGQIPAVGTPFLLTLIILMTSAFFLHEFSHKFAARRLGYSAEFRLVRYGSYLTLFSTILPFRILSPGAVVIYLGEDGKITQEEYGKIALAGPTANTIIGFLLMLGAFLSMDTNIFIICVLGSTFSIDLAWFNLMPVSVLDGAKIRRWSETAWATVFIAACLLKLASLLVLILM